MGLTLSAGLFLLLGLLVALLLLLLLWRAGAARALTVWLLAALLPLVAALSAAFSAQARAARLVEAYQPLPTVVVMTTAGRQYRAVLEGLDAACLERSVRLHSSVNLNTPQGFIPIREDTRVGGNLPAPELVQALSIRGELSCPHFVPSRQPDAR